MAESPSEQDEIKRIPCSAWLPERVRCTHLFVGGLVGGGGLREFGAWLYSWFQLMWYIIGCEEELNLCRVANSTSPSVYTVLPRFFALFSDPFPHYLGAWNRLFPIKNFVILLFQYKKSFWSEKSAVSITHHNDDGKKGVHVPLAKGHSQAQPRPQGFSLRPWGRGCRMH